MHGPPAEITLLKMFCVTIRIYIADYVLDTFVCVEICRQYQAG
jgi:hypothetical protein